MSDGVIMNKTGLSEVVPYCDKKPWNGFYVTMMRTAGDGNGLNETLPGVLDF